jgi:transposase
VTPLGHPARSHPAGANAADSPHLPALVAGITTGAVPADSGSDADPNRAAVRAQGADPCLPPRGNRTEPIACDRHLYRERDVVERFFGRTKQHRRVATRYDRQGRNHLGFVWVAAIAVMLA